MKSMASCDLIRPVNPCLRRPNLFYVLRNHTFLWQDFEGVFLDLICSHFYHEYEMYKCLIYSAQISILSLYNVNLLHFSEKIFFIATELFPTTNGIPPLIIENCLLYRWKKNSSTKWEKNYCFILFTSGTYLAYKVDICTAFSITPIILLYLSVPDCLCFYILLLLLCYAPLILSVISAYLFGKILLTPSSHATCKE